MHYKCNSSHNCAICQMDIVPCIASFGTEEKEKGLGDNGSIPGSATGSLFDLGKGFLTKICRPFSIFVVAHPPLFLLGSGLHFWN